MNLRINFSSHDCGMLDKALTDTIDVLKKHSVNFIGPIPLRSGVCRSRSHSGYPLHRRMMDIVPDHNWSHAAIELERNFITENVILEMKYLSETE